MKPELTEELKQRLKEPSKNLLNFTKNLPLTAHVQEERERERERELAPARILRTKINVCFAAKV